MKENGLPALIEAIARMAESVCTDPLYCSKPRKQKVVLGGREIMVCDFVVEEECPIASVLKEALSQN